MIHTVGVTQAKYCYRMNINSVSSSSFFSVTLHTAIKEKINVYINNNTNYDNNNFAEKNEGDREDANRPHGHLVKQPPNVRQKKKHNYIL